MSDFHRAAMRTYVRMRDRHEVASVLELVEKGLNDGNISERTGIPRSTVRDWRAGQIPQQTDAGCDLCNGLRPQLPESKYAYLLGLYLGDGCISALPRTFRMRIVLDAAYPLIVKECAESLRAVRPTNAVWTGPHGSGAVVVSMYWNHWPCLFPQHGPGRKHLRPIFLAPWQAAIAERQRRQLVRGMIHSDGCRVVANDRGVTSIRYHFSNLSEDIKQIYCNSLDALGIPWTRPSYKDIAVYRKAATAHLDEFVGPKR